MNNKTYQYISNVRKFLDKIKYGIDDEIYLHPKTSKKMYHTIEQLVKIIEEET